MAFAKALAGDRLVLEWSHFRLPLEHYQYETFTLRELALHDPQLTFRLSDDRKSVEALTVFERLGVRWICTSAGSP